MKLDVNEMVPAADEASELLKAIANRHRLLLLCQMIDRKRSVGELADFLELRPSTVSQHLALLRKDGLVSAERDGQTIWYTISSNPAREVLRTLYRVCCTPKKPGRSADPQDATPDENR